MSNNKVEKRGKVTIVLKKCQKSRQERKRNHCSRKESNNKVEKSGKGTIVLEKCQIIKYKREVKEP